MHLSRDGIQMSGDQIESEIDQIAPEQISRFFLFDGELLGEYESLLIEGSEQGRQIREAIEQVLGVPALINGRTELGAILKSATKRQSSELSHIQGLEKQAERQLELTAKQDAYDRDLQELQAKLARVRADREGSMTIWKPQHRCSLRRGSWMLCQFRKTHSKKFERESVQNVCSFWHKRGRTF